MHVNKLLITDRPIRNEQKWSVIAGVPYPLSLQSPSPFSFLTIPYPFRRLLRMRRLVI